jgi:peptidyl-prolyl cis-trans isomerase D
MLSYMRKNAGSWMIKVLLFGVALSFVIGFGILPTLQDEEGVGVVVAQVGDRRITRGEWNQAYESLLEVYRQAYQDRFSDEMIRQLRLRETALDNLINQVLQLQEARRLGLEISAEALQDRIRSLPYFQQDGRFSKDRYLRVLQMNRLTPGDFEKQQMDQMLVEAFQDFVRGTVKVSEQELWNSYALDKDQIRFEAFAVNPPAYESAVAVDPGALRDYYQKNAEEFLTQEKIKIAYVQIDPARYRDQVTVYTGDVEEYYDSHIEDFSMPEELRMRHILLLLPPGSDESVRTEKRKTLEGLLGRIRAGEDFAELAKAYSEDASSRQAGGDLGYVKRGKLVPEVEGVAFGLKPGEVSDIVSSSYGLHLIKVEDYRASKVEPLEDVQEKIRATLTEEKGWRLARRKAEEVSWDLKEKGAFPEAGSPLGDSVVQQTGFLARTDSLAGQEGESSLTQAAFSLEPGQVSDVIRGEKGYYFLKVLEKKAPEIPPFEEVQGRVEEGFRRQESKELARKKAEEILQRARSGISSEELATQEGLETLDTGFVSRIRKFIPGIGVSEELLEAAFNLTKEEPWPERTFEVNGRFFVIRFQERRAPDREAFDAEQEDLRRRQEAQKGQEIYRQWLAELRKRHEVKITGVEA